VTQRLVLRAPQALIAEGTTSPILPANVAVTPLSTEVSRAMEANSTAYSTEKSVLAGRLNVPLNAVLGDPGKVVDATQKAALAKENTILTHRFGFAAKLVDRGDAASIKDAQQAAMNVEGIPRYDHIFIVMLENKATLSIKNTNFAPRIQGYLAANNQFTNYFATGNPSEPNYTALGGADDWGNRRRQPVELRRHRCECPHGSAAAHEGPAGPRQLTVCGYLHADGPDQSQHQQSAESVHRHQRCRHELAHVQRVDEPGQDVRTDSIADASITAPDHVYAPGTTGGNATTIGNLNLQLAMPAGLYKTKHHRAWPTRLRAARLTSRAATARWAAASLIRCCLNSTKYPIPAGLRPRSVQHRPGVGRHRQPELCHSDQCDDMHGVTLSGKDSTTGASANGSDCGSVANNYPVGSPTAAGTIITRGDNYVDYLVKKIEGLAGLAEPE